MVRDTFINYGSEAKIKTWEKFKIEDLILSNEYGKFVEYPFRQKSGGKQFGLSILVNPELGEYSTCSSSDGSGFKVGMLQASQHLT